MNINALSLSMNLICIIFLYCLVFAIITARSAFTTAEQTEAYSTSCAYCLLLMADGFLEMADGGEAFWCI
jgi:hypothetical protein